MNTLASPARAFSTVCLTISLTLSNFGFLGQNITKPNIKGPFPGIEVNSYNGNLFVQRQDIFIRSQGIDLEIVFSFNTSYTGLDFGYGFGWTHNLNVLYDVIGTDVLIRTGDGQKHLYQFSAGNYEPPIGNYSQLTEYEPGKYLLTDRDGSKMYFDDSTHKKLTRWEDRYGNGLDLEYTSSNLTTVTDASGRELNFTWTDNRLSQITDSNGTATRQYDYQYVDGLMVSANGPLGAAWSYGYDNERKISSITKPGGGVCDVSYNTARAVSGLLTSITNQTIDYNGGALTSTLFEQLNGEIIQTAHVYDASGRVVDISNPCCSPTSDLQFVYDSNDNVIEKTDGNGQTTFYTYDALGNRISTTDPLGTSVNRTFNPLFGRMQSQTDALGNVMIFTYDPNGNLVQEDHPEGVTITRTFDPSGNVLSVTDGEGNTTFFGYNSNGYRTSILHPIGSEAFTYDNVGNMTSSTDQNGQTTTFEYDILDRMTSMTDPLGNTTSRSYDIEGNLLTETSPCGIVIAYTYDILNRQISKDLDGAVSTTSYDERGNVIARQDANGGISIYEYNAQNQLVSETNALGSVATYTYDSNANRVSATDFNGNTWTYTYDANNRQTMETDPLGGSTSYTYDDNGNLLTETDPLGNTISYSYDGLDRLIAETNAAGTESYTYDLNSNRTGVTNRNGNFTSFTYDSMGRLTTMTDANGGIMTTNYDMAGNVTTVVDPVGASATFTYDAANRRITQSNALGEQITYTYDACGRNTQLTLPNGNIINYTLNAMNLTSHSADGLGDLSQFTYDDKGNMLTKTNPNGETWTYDYDALDRLTQSTDPAGAISTFAYDGNSNPTSSTDRNGNTTTSSYDALDRLLQHTDASGNTITSAYDPAGNLISMTDDNGNTTQYAYDAVNQLVTHTNADGSMRSYAYDAHGNRTSVTDEAGITSNYLYDPLNRLTSILYGDGEINTYGYDAAGRMTSANNSSATINFAYDLANRMTSEEMNGNTTSFAYNAATGQRTISYPGGTVVTEQRDLRDQMATITKGGFGVASFSHNLSGQLTQRTTDNGVVATYDYDAVDRLTSISHVLVTDTIFGFQYGRDAEGIKQYEHKVHKPEWSESYTYDNLYRIQGFDRGLLSGEIIPVPIRSDSYNLDGVSNRVSTIEDTENTNYTTNSINQYTQISGLVTTNPTFDPVGRQTNDGLYTYTYNAANQLVAVDGGAIATYEYDALGRRISKQTAAGITNFYFHNNRVIEERNGFNTVEAEYVYGDWVDDVILMVRNSQNHYYHKNLQNSVAGLTDQAGQVIERYEYDPFGQFVSYDGSYNPMPVNSGNPYFYTGRRLDPESGLYFFRNRYYNARHGYFTTPDPSGFNDGMSLYGGYFAESFALDPLGLWRQDITFKPKFDLLILSIKFDVDGFVEIKGTPGVPEEDCLTNWGKPKFDWDIDPYTYWKDGGSGSGIKAHIALVSGDFHIKASIHYGAETTWGEWYSWLHWAEAIANVNFHNERAIKWGGKIIKWVPVAPITAFEVQKGDPCVCYRLNSEGKFKVKVRFYPVRTLASQLVAVGLAARFKTAAQTLKTGLQELKGLLNPVHANLKVVYNF